MDPVIEALLLLGSQELPPPIKYPKLTKPRVGPITLPIKPIIKK
jgi:hypothetical protein